MSTLTFGLVAWVLVLGISTLPVSDALVTCDIAALNTTVDWNNILGTWYLREYRGFKVASDVHKIRLELSIVGANQLHYQLWRYKPDCEAPIPIDYDKTGSYSLVKNTINMGFFWFTQSAAFFPAGDDTLYVFHYAQLPATSVQYIFVLSRDRDDSGASLGELDSNYWNTCSDTGSPITDSLNGTYPEDTC